MAIYTEQEQPTQNQRIFKNLGTGLGEGLHLLAQQRMEDMHRQRKHGQISNALKSLNIPNHDQLAALDPTILKGIVDYHQKAPERQAYGQLAGQILGNDGENSNQNPLSYGQNSNINIPSNTQLSSGSFDKLINLQQKQQSNKIAQENLKLKQDTGAIKQRESILKEPGTKNYIEGLTEDKDIAQEYLPIVKRMLELETKNDLWGGGAGYLPNILTNEDSGEYNTLANRLAKFEIKDIGGQPTAFKIKFAKNDLKPQLAWPKAKRVKELERLESELEYRDAKYNTYEEIKDDTESLKHLNSSIKQKLLDSLPQDTYEDGTPVLDGDEGTQWGKKVVRKKGKWMFGSK